MLLQTALAAALCFVPLFDLLGYEFCLVTGLLSAITSPIIGLGVARRTDRPGHALTHAMGLALLHLTPGLLLISLNASRVRNCNYLEGLFFFLLLPVSTALYGSTMGLLIGRIFVSSHAAGRAFMGILAVLAPLGTALWTLYNEPPIFVFDHLWGYFAGSLYDESIAIDARLWVFRGGTLLRIAAMAAWVGCWERWAKLGTGFVLTVLLTAGLSIYVYETSLGPRVGFRISRQVIEERLPLTVARPGLVVHLHAGIDTARQEAIADDHAFRLQQLTERLGTTPPETIHSYMYRNAEEKAALMGGRNTMIAKPWLHEIHVHGPVAPHSVMPHELAHAVAASFGSAWLQVSAQHEIFVNMGFVEGLAQALTPEANDDELDLHHWAKAMRDLQLAPDMRAIFGPGGFWSQAPRRAYTVAGSFVRFLLDQYGATPLKLAYAGGDFAGAYNKSLNTLVGEWETFIDTVKVTPREQHIAAERFRSPSIFSRPCAHEIAQLTAAAEQADPQNAVTIRRQICEHLGNAPSSRLELAQSLRRAGDQDGFLALAKELLSTKELNTVQQADLLQSRSDVLWEQNLPVQAREAARAVLDLQISIAAERLAWVRLWAMDLRAPVGNDVLHFLSGRIAPVAAILLLDQEAIANPSEKTFPYLIARQLHHAEAWEMALKYLYSAGPHPFTAIEAERQRLIGDSLWRLKRYDAATAAFTEYEQKAATSGEVINAQDWLTRLAWLSKRRTKDATD